MGVDTIWVILGGIIGVILVGLVLSGLSLLYPEAFEKPSVRYLSVGVILSIPLGVFGYLERSTHTS